MVRSNTKSGMLSAASRYIQLNSNSWSMSLVICPSQVPLYLTDSYRQLHVRMIEAKMLEETSSWRIVTLFAVVRYLVTR